MQALAPLQGPERRLGAWLPCLLKPDKVKLHEHCASHIDLAKDFNAFVLSQQVRLIQIHMSL